MQIGDIPFKIHAHIVKKATFRLLLGCPFHKLLLCQVEDLSSKQAEVTIWDPRNITKIITIPSRNHLTRVGCIRILSYNSATDLPQMKTLKQHTINSTYNASNYHEQNPTTALVYKKVTKKVHPVATSLLEDFRIIRQRSEDPLLTL